MDRVIEVEKENKNLKKQLALIIKRFDKFSVIAVD